MLRRTDRSRKSGHVKYSYVEEQRKERCDIEEDRKAEMRYGVWANIYRPSTHIYAPHEIWRP